MMQGGGPGVAGRSLRARAARASSFLAALFLLAACATAPVDSTRTAVNDPRNGDGIGGTGIKLADNGDGLGGTGIIGTISGFGSIIVNSKKLDFDRSTAVESDGRPANLEDLFLKLAGRQIREDG